jgi:hypothetical protein
MDKRITIHKEADVSEISLKSFFKGDMNMGQLWRMALWTSNLYKFSDSSCWNNNFIYIIKMLECFNLLAPELFF